MQSDIQIYIAQAALQGAPSCHLEGGGGATGRGGPGSFTKLMLESMSMSPMLPGGPWKVSCFSAFRFSCLTAVDARPFFKIS